MAVGGGGDAGRGRGGERTSAARVEAGDRRGRWWAAEVMRGREGGSGEHTSAARAGARDRRGWRWAAEVMRGKEGVTDQAGFSDGDGSGGTPTEYNNGR
jgi:hypothetical protein